MAWLLRTQTVLHIIIKITFYDEPSSAGNTQLVLVSFMIENCFVYEIKIKILREIIWCIYGIHIKIVNFTV